MSTAIRSLLRDSSGTVQTDPTGLGQVCSEYYRNLYDTPPSLEDLVAAMHDFSNLLWDRFDSKAKELLRSSFSEQELRRASFRDGKGEESWSRWNKN